MIALVRIFLFQIEISYTLYTENELPIKAFDESILNMP